MSMICGKCDFSWCFVFVLQEFEICAPENHKRHDLIPLFRKSDCRKRRDLYHRFSYEIRSNKERTMLSHVHCAHCCDDTHNNNTKQNKTCVLAHRDDDDNDLDAKSVSILYHSVVSYSFIFRWFLNEIYLKWKHIFNGIRLCDCIRI